MIKCNVSLCAEIIRSATVKNSSDGSRFLSFGIKIPIEGRDGSKKDLIISVSTDGDKGDSGALSQGRIVELSGTLSVRKKDGKTFFNLRTEQVKLVSSKSALTIGGTMDFRGKIGKNGVDEKKDKKDNLFKSFSAFSTDKDGDKAEFTWVRFVYFNPKEGEGFLQANSYIEAKGDLQLGVYKDEISLDCVLRDVSPWELNK